LRHVPIINCISVDMMVIKEWQEKDAQIKRGRKGPKAHRPPPLTAGVVFVLFKIFLILALHDTNADDGHSLCTLAKQESVERDLTPDIPEPIIVPFLWPPVSLFLPSLWPYTLPPRLCYTPPPPHDEDPLLKIETKSGVAAACWLIPSISLFHLPVNEFS
jgi:hypothetical protein